MGISDKPLCILNNEMRSGNSAQVLKRICDILDTDFDGI